MKKAIIFTVVGSVAAAAAIYCATFQHSATEALPIALPEGFTVTAHTGCEGTKDNTLESISAGVEAGADIVEIDLHFLPDGTPVLNHDRPDGDKILPTLDSALELLTGLDVKMNIDVKATDNMAEAYALIRKHGTESKVFFTGVEDDDVEAVKSSAPGIPYYLNVSVDKKINTDFAYLESLVKKVKDSGAIGINMKFTACSDELVRFFRSEGLLVSLWTANSKREMKRCLALSPDNITTRKPSVLKGIIVENKA